MRGQNSPSMAYKFPDAVIKNKGEVVSFDPFADYEKPNQNAFTGDGKIAYKNYVNDEFEKRQHFDPYMDGGQYYHNNSMSKDGSWQTHVTQPKHNVKRDYIDNFATSKTNPQNQPETYFFEQYKQVHIREEEGLVAARIEEFLKQNEEIRQLKEYNEDFLLKCVRGGYKGRFLYLNRRVNQKVRMHEITSFFPLE